MYYSKLKSMVTENEIYMCIYLINRIKEHRHNKIKTRQIDKFKCLVFKRKSGYLDNFTRHNNSTIFNNTGQNLSLSGHALQCSQSSSSTNHAVSTEAAYVTPSTTASAPTVLAPAAPSVVDNNINNNIKQKWVINLTNTTLTTAQETLLARGPNSAIVPKYPPKKPRSQLLRRPAPNSLPEKWRNSSLTPVDC